MLNKQIFGIYRTVMHTAHLKISRHEKYKKTQQWQKTKFQGHTTQIQITNSQKLHNNAPKSMSKNALKTTQFITKQHNMTRYYSLK